MLTIRRLDPASDTDLLPALAALLVETVAGGASIGFMAGFSAAAAGNFWTQRVSAAAAGAAVILVALDGDRLVGTATLAIDMPPNQPHRADVQKLMVAAAAQGQGVGAALMTAIEAEARQQRRTTLVLDTISGSAAARLYEHLGWQRIGEIGDFALMPDGAMAPTTVYAKYL